MNFPAEEKAFDAILEDMFAALDEPLTTAKRRVFKQSFSNLAINEFARCRDKLLKNLQDGMEVPKSFGPSNIWAIRNSLRSPAPAQTAPTDTRFDDWDITANRRLMFYVRWKAGRRIYYAYPDDDSRTREIIAPLLGYKAAWVTDIRDYIAEHNQPPPDDVQKKWWIECMRRAEEQIKDIRQGYTEDLSCPVS